MEAQMTLDDAVTNLLAASRITGKRQSYATDNPAESSAVFAYLKGGSRPASVSTKLGLGLVALEDQRRAVVQPPPPPPPPPAPSGYQLVWADEFDGDLSKWNVRDNTTTNNQLAEYIARNAVANGVLMLRALNEQIGGKQYSSAYLDTIGKFSLQYGRWEIRCKCPTAVGMWPAFWLRGNAGPCELDVMETVGGMDTLVAQTVWADTNGGSNVAKHGFNFSGSTIYDWHLYAVEREPGVIREYVDGTLVNTVTVSQYPWLDAAFYEPMNIRLNLQVGGSMPSYYGKTPGTIAPGSGDFVVDYVRVYQKAA